MKKNTLLISIIFFSISIVLFVITYSWYFVIINTPRLIDINGGQTSELIYYLGVIPWYLVSIIFTAIGLLLIIIYTFVLKETKSEDRINMIKMRNTLLPISIAFFSIGITISLIGLIQFIIISPRNYVNNLNGYSITEIYSYLFVILDFVSFILTIIGLILVINYTSKSRETDKKELNLPKQMKRDILYFSILFLIGSLGIFYVALLWYFVKKNPFNSFLIIGAKIYAVSFYSGVIWGHIISSGLTLIGLILVISYISLSKKAKYNDENDRKKLKKTLLFISIPFFVFSVAIFVFGLVQAIDYFYTNYNMVFNSQLINVFNSAFFLILYFVSTVLTVIGLILVINYIDKSKKINKTEVVISKTA